MPSPLFATSFGDRQWKDTAVLLHGFLGSAVDWKDVVSELVRSEVFCLVIDLPFHGKSKECPADSVGHAAELVVAAIARSSLRNFCLIGYSLGGRVAIEVARCTDAATGLVLVSTEPGLRDADVRQHRLEADIAVADKIGRLPLRLFLENWYSLTMWGSNFTQNAAFPALLERRVSENSVEALQQAVQVFSVGSARPNWDFLESSKPKVPFLFVSGNADPKYHKYGAELSTFGHSHSIPDAGHNVVFEKPAEVAHLCRLFAWRYCSEDIAFGSKPLFVSQFCLPLVRHMTVGKEVITGRCGLLLTAETQSGTPVFGEVSPLAGFHNETLEVCLAEVSSLASKLAGLCLKRPDLGIDNGSLKRTILSLAAGGSLSGCTVAGLEQLLLHGSIVDSKVTPAEGLAALCGDFGLHDQSAIKLNGIVSRSSVEADGHVVPDLGLVVLDLADKGFQVVKLKVGHRSVIDDAVLVNRLTSTFRKHGLTIRLDANRLWSLEEACEFMSRLEYPNDIEYIEEPVKDMAQMDSFGEMSGARVAVDESIAENRMLLQMTKLRHIVAVVAKPSLLGGFTDCFQLIQQARSLGVQEIVISSTFESGLTLAWLAVFAGQIDPEDKSHHGLGTFTDLVGDLCQPPIASLYKGGCLDISGCNHFITGFRPDLKYCNIL